MWDEVTLIYIKHCPSLEAKLTTYSYANRDDQCQDRAHIGLRSIRYTGRYVNLGLIAMSHV